MSEIGDMWREVKAQRSAYKAANLAAADPTGWCQHTPWHWQRTIDGKLLDYWPSTRKYQYNGRVYYGDAMDLVRKIETRMAYERDMMLINHPHD